jgi:hypothetical protein
VVLDCLENCKENPRALDLSLLYSYASYKDQNWQENVMRELEGESNESYLDYAIYMTARQHFFTES